MASNTFYVTRCSNTSYNGLKNGGEVSFERSAATSTSTKDLGKVYFTTSGTIPRIATINKINFGHDLRMNRKSTALYKTISKTRLYVNGASKSSEQSSSAVGDTWIGFGWDNSSSISSKDLYDGEAYQTVKVTYQGLLKTTQYIRNLRITVDWSAIYATAVSIGSNRSIYIGDTVTLSPTYTPSEISYPGVTYTSSNTSVATVNSSGVVTGVAKGTATITATTTDGSNKSGSITVTVKKAVTGVSLNKTSLTLDEGKTETLTATVSPSDASVTTVSWSSSNTSIATVNSSGVVTAKSKGTCTITATSTDDSNKKATCSVTVLRRVTGMYVSSNNVNVDVGGTTAITVHTIPSDASNTSFTISSADSTIATMNSSGTISGLKKGQTTITVTSVDGGYSQTITVNVIQRVTSISVSPKTKTIDEGETYSLSVTVLPEDANNKNYSFSVGSSSIASVSTQNVVTGISKGTTTITVTSADNSSIKDITSVTVIRRVSSMYISKTQTSIDVGKTEKISAHVVPETANNTNFTWSTSNSSVATIDSDGTIHAISRGTATISATSEDGGYVASCVVTTIQRVTGITISAPATVTLDENETYSFEVTILPSNANNKNFSTSSSNTSIASLNSNTEVLAKSKGQCTITVTSEDGGFTASFSVNVLRRVTGVQISNSTLSVEAGKNAQLSAIISPSGVSNPNVSWSSSNTSIATVDSNGKITAVAAGQCSITVTTEDGGFSDSCALTVTPNDDILNIVNGINRIKNIKIGTTNISKCYLGTIKIFDNT